MNLSNAIADHGVTREMPGVTVNLSGLDAALDTITRRAAAGRGFSLFTVNLDHLVKLRNDARFRQAYGAVDFVTPDGWPVVWMLRRQGYSAERTTGADLAEPLCARAAREGFPVYFIGPGSASQARALDILCRRYPTLDVAGAEAPDLLRDVDGKTIEALAHRIRLSGARLCFVSLGAPKQELLANALRELCPAVGFLCVGAALDFISSHAVRAPRWVQSWQLEWLWRMMGDPKRLAPRYVECMAFFGSIFWRKLFNLEVCSVVRGLHSQS